MPSTSDNAPIAGTHDLLGNEIAVRFTVQRRLQDLLFSHGYAPIDVPVLEQTDLYLRKLGSQVASRMFNLTDQRGARLSMRPEFTGSVIRTYLNYKDNLTCPVRWQYCGPVFRDHEQYAGEPRQFTQLGVELIGTASPRADAELLALACRGSQALGLSSLRLVIGHAGLVPRLLEGMQISERARLYLGAHLELARDGADGLDRLRQGLQEVLVLPAEQLAERPTPRNGLATEEASNLAGWFLREGTSRHTGRRTPEEIVRRFRDKLEGADDPKHLERALALAADLAKVTAPPEEALQRGREIAQRYGLDPGPLEELRDALDLLAAYDLQGVVVEVDLGLTRALGYYTGLVFELVTGGHSTAVCGGGRYDGLIRALGGGQDAPALGFAYTLERLMDALPAQSDASDGAAKVLVLPAEDAAFPHAVRYADALRAKGEIAVVDTHSGTGEDARSRAETLGYTRMVVARTDGVEAIDLMVRAAHAPDRAS